MAKFMRNIDLVQRCSGFYKEEKLAPYGIAGCQSKYIIEICLNPGITQEELSRSLFLHKSNVARQINLLVKDGYVTREQKDGDRRAYLLYPTQKAMDILSDLRAVHAGWREFITTGFTEEEKAQLSYLTEKLVQNARGYMESKQ
ncbi:MAG: MarR family transcriptional regulator [Clostridia bacterium]|nr:MarR family transcriptional regulator [Clostridia bacterium]